MSSLPDSGDLRKDGNQKHLQLSDGSPLSCSTQVNGASESLIVEVHAGQTGNFESIVVGGKGHVYGFSSPLIA